MRSSLYSFALLALPFIGTVFCEEPASPTQDADANQLYPNVNEAFQDLLNALPEESLHVALNSLTRFKDGVFESDRHGVEHVHHDNPPLATKLIIAAVQDLKKRQQPQPTNGTVPTSTPGPTSEQPSSQPPVSQSPTSQPPASQSPASQPPASQTPSSNPPDSQAPSSSAPPPPSSSAPPAAVIPVKITTTDSDGKPTVVSSELLSKATAFVPIEVTKTNDQGATVVTQETKPAVIFTVTDSAGSAIVTTSAVNFAPTAGQVITTTDSAGSTFLTTYTPDGGRVSSIVLITSMGPNGQPTVITSYTYVDPAEATATNGQAPASGTNTAKPGLQSGAARKNLAVEMAFVGGAVGGAFALFV